MQVQVQIQVSKLIKELEEKKIEGIEIIKPGSDPLVLYKKKFVLAWV